MTDKRYEVYLTNKKLLLDEIDRMNRVVIPPSEGLNKLLAQRETAPLVTGATIASLVKRPSISYRDIAQFDTTRKDAPSDGIIEKAETELKYEGYLKRQKIVIDKQRRLENMALSPELDYALVTGLRIEARDKLNKAKPLSIGQASRISGVNPADISVLTIWLTKEKRRNDRHNTTD